MLQWLRDNLKTFAWTLWVVIAAFILLYIPDFLGQSPLGKDVVAGVGDRQVGRNEFMRAVKRQEASYRQALGDNYDREQLRQMGLYQQVLNQLLGQKILVREADTLGLTVTDEEVREAILQEPSFRDEAGRFIGNELYLRILRANDFQNIGEFESTIRESILVSKLQQVLAANVFIPDAAVEERYRRNVEKAAIRFVQLPATEFADQVEVSQEEIATYYEARREEYRRPEQRVLSYLLVDNALLRAELEITDADLRAYYEQNIETFQVPEQVRARHILLRVDESRSAEQAEARLNEARRRIQGGADFAGIAQELSEDPGSAAQGGDLGYFGRGAMVPQFEEAAFSATAGELVGPIRSDFGAHLIEVTDRREAGTRPFEEVRNQIRFRLQGERSEGLAETRARALLTRLGEAEASPAPAELEALAAESQAITFATSEPVGMDDPVGTLGRVPALNQAAFALEEGALTTEPVAIPRGFVIVRVDEVIAPRLPELSEVEGEVRQAIVVQKQEQRLMEALQAAREAIASGAKTLESVAQELGLTVQESGEFGHDQPVGTLGQAPAVSRVALGLEQGSIGGPIKTARGAVLFEVAERTTWDPAAFEGERDQTRQELEAEEVDRLLSAIVADVMRDPDTLVDNEYLTSLTG